MQTFFLYLVLLVVAIWTARLAIARGRNPWVWGGASLLMGVVPWHLIGIAPLLILLFLKNPAATPPARPARPSCPKCAQPHGAGQKFCTGCGWDLSQTYSPDETATARTSGVSTAGASSQVAGPAPTPTAGTAVATESPKDSPAAPAEAPGESPVPSPVDVTGTPGSPGSPDSSDAKPSSDEPGPTVAEEPAEAPYKPWGTPEPGIAPTAVAMTARGANLLNEGRVQEAIDQFTKAIALDANHAEAWEKRAEAYAIQGRGEEAASDRRNLKRLKTSSSPG